ncbi:DUF6678 family protein [Shewanella algae]|uniref:DUF6678 family protein n=1 Tax=Shewanella algae TaxID=38313 RepID=UPI0023587E43|nr:DUF6678 family protein [Shewanella algae]MDC8855730.1 hypothetical protein [Shewanella algae]
MSKSHNIEQVDTLTRDTYKVSLMSNAKWDKAMEVITDLYEDGVALNYKLVYSEEIYSTYMWTPDFKPFFQEPVFYKELEWIEIPSEYIGPVSINNLKAGEKIHEQKVDNIPTELDKIGSFDIEASSIGVRIYGYKK